VSTGELVEAIAPWTIAAAADGSMLETSLAILFLFETDRLRVFLQKSLNPLQSFQNAKLSVLSGLVRPVLCMCVSIKKVQSKKKKKKKSKTKINLLLQL